MQTCFLQLVKEQTIYTQTKIEKNKKHRK